MRLFSPAVELTTERAKKQATLYRRFYQESGAGLAPAHVVWSARAGPWRREAVGEGARAGPWPRVAAPCSLLSPPSANGEHWRYTQRGRAQGQWRAPKRWWNIHRRAGAPRVSSDSVLALLCMFLRGFYLLARACADRYSFSVPLLCSEVSAWVVMENVDQQGAEPGVGENFQAVGTGREKD